MEPDELAPDQTTAEPAKSSWAWEARTAVAILIMYSAVEGIFLLRLWPLIHVKASLSYVMPACLFQATLISSAIQFRRCLRLGPGSGEGTKKQLDFESQLVALVMSLLLSLILFSSFTSAYDRVKP